MRAFWAHGYEGTSVDRLSRMMRMPRASLYQFFGDKQGLFLSAVAHYGQTRIARVLDRADDEPDLARAIAGFFDDMIALATGDPETLGCLVACVLADAAGADARLRTELARRFEVVEARLCERLSRDDAVLPRGADRRALAGMIAATARGLMLRARAGAAPEELRRISSTMAGLIPFENIRQTA